jgi:hypothetical protein
VQVFTSERPPVQVPLAGLPGSPNGILRISASDGFDAASMQSDPIGVPNTPPPIWILTPGDGEVVPFGGRVVFQGVAGGAVSAEARLEWSSDRDGLLGEGWEFSTRSLSGGLHTVTLTLTDGPDSTAQATVRIAVDPAVTRATPPPEWERQMAAAFAGSRPEPEASARAPVLGLAIVLGGIALAGAIGLAAAWWVVSRRRR